MQNVSVSPEASMTKALVVRLVLPPLMAVALVMPGTGCQRANPDGSPAAPTSSAASPAGGGTTAVISAIVDVAADLLDVTTGYTGTDNWVGQSVTIPGSGTYNNLRFNWYHYNPAGTPVAFGTLYLLTQEYTGLSSGLGPATPGFVARSEAVKDSQYVFPAAVTVAGGKRYWFYSDTRGRFTTSFNKDIYGGGDLYVTGYPTNPFTRAQASWLLLPSGEYLKPAPGTGVDANFKLQGAAIQ
jgi:hypothetical protein